MGPASRFLGFGSLGMTHVRPPYPQQKPEDSWWGLLTRGPQWGCAHFGPLDVELAGPGLKNSLGGGKDAFVAIPWLKVGDPFLGWGTC